MQGAMSLEELKPLGERSPREATMHPKTSFVRHCTRKTNDIVRVDASGDLSFIVAYKDNVPGFTLYPPLIIY